MFARPRPPSAYPHPPALQDPESKSFAIVCRSRSIYPEAAGEARLRFDPGFPRLVPATPSSQLGSGSEPAFAIEYDERHPLELGQGSQAAQKIALKITALARTASPSRDEKRDQILEVLSKDRRTLYREVPELIGLLIRELGGPAIRLADLEVLLKKLLLAPGMTSQDYCFVGDGLCRGLSRLATEPARLTHTGCLTKFLYANHGLSQETHSDMVSFSIIGMFFGMAEPKFQADLLRRLVAEFAAPPQTEFSAGCVGIALGKFASRAAGNQPMKSHLREQVVDGMRCYMGQAREVVSSFARHLFRELAGPHIHPPTAQAMMNELLDLPMPIESARSVGAATCTLLPDEKEGKASQKQSLQKSIVESVRSALNGGPAGGIAPEFLVGMFEGLGGPNVPPESLRRLLGSLLRAGLSPSSARAVGTSVWFSLAGSSKALEPGLQSEVIKVCKRVFESNPATAIHFVSGMIVQMLRDECAGKIRSLLADLFAADLNLQSAFHLGEQLWGHAKGLDERDREKAKPVDELGREKEKPVDVLVREIEEAVLMRKGIPAAMVVAAGMLIEHTKRGEFPALARPLMKTWFAWPLDESDEQLGNSFDEQMLGNFLYNGLCAGVPLERRPPLARQLVEALQDHAKEHVHGAPRFAAHVMKGFCRTVGKDTSALRALLQPILEAQLTPGVRSQLLLGWAEAIPPRLDFDVAIPPDAAGRFDCLQELVRAADHPDQRKNVSLGKCMGIALGAKKATLQDLQKLLAIVLAPARDPSRMNGLLRGLPAGLGGKDARIELLEAIENARELLATGQSALPASASASALPASAGSAASAGRRAVEDSAHCEEAAERITKGLAGMRPGQAILFLKGESSRFVNALKDGCYGIASAMICAICEESPREEWDRRTAALDNGGVSTLADFMDRVIPDAERAAGSMLTAANPWMDRIVLQMHSAGEPLQPMPPIELYRFDAEHARVVDTKASPAIAHGITQEDLDALIPEKDRHLASTSVPALLKSLRKAVANPHAVARGMRLLDGKDEQFIPDSKTYPHIHIVGGRIVWSGKAQSGRPTLLRGENVVVSMDSLRQFYDETNDLSIRLVLLLLVLHYLSFDEALDWIS
jgi:hypothetical protein